MNVATDIRTIEQLGAQVLRQVAVPVDRVDDASVKDVIGAMLSTLAGTQGVGLAAPQIGESLRIVIIASRPTPRYPMAPDMAPTVMINPEFKVLSDETEKGWEGCLSIPGIRALVPRYREIAVSYLDRQGALHEAVFEDFVARIFQHEYDHLEGLVYLDRVENSRDIISEQEYQKLVADAE